MALWALAMVLTSAVGLVVAGLGVYFVARTLRLQYEANRDAREQFHVQQRPWIVVEPYPDDTSVAHDESVVSGDFKLMNIGPSPAINVGISGLVARTDKNRDPLAAMARRMARLKRLGRIGGRTLFPGRGFIYHFAVSLDGLQRPLASPFLLEGVVTYQWRPDGPIYSTPFILEVKFWREGGDQRPAKTVTAESKWHYPPE